MRRFYTKTLFAALLLLYSSVVSAADFEVGSFYYNIIDANEKTVEVTFIGSSYDYVNDDYRGNLEIPSKATFWETTYTVVGIGKNAFRDCYTIKGITIPQSVKYIGEYAFYNCPALTNVTIGSGVTNMGLYAFSDCPALTSVKISNGVTTIGNYAFYNCIGLTNITIPNSVTGIKEYAFSGCTALTSVKIGSGVTTIGFCAFNGCTGLTSITIPNSVKDIGSYAFEGCKGLRSVTLSNGVKSISRCAFQGCTNITSITIPNSVTRIDDRAFGSCFGLTSITIPNSVTDIGTNPLIEGQLKGNPFSNCSGLISIKIENGNTKYDSRDNCNAIIETATNTLITGCRNTIIPNGVTSIISAFEGCSELRSITIPNSVTSIGYYAFSSCGELTNIIIPNSVTTIESHAFYNCEKLTNITIPNNVTKIGYSAFEYCDGLKKVIIPNSVTTIDDRAFCNCRGGVSIISLATTAPTIGENTFKPISSKKLYYPLGSDYSSWIPYFITAEEIFEKDGIIYSITSSTDYTVKIIDCTAIGTIEIPETVKLGTKRYEVTGIAASAFTDGVTNIEIPATVTSIDAQAFVKCNTLKSIVVDEKNTTYDSRDNCVAIISYNTLVAGCPNTIIPNSVTAIGSNAFYDCTGLKTIAIPSNVTTIGSKAFYGCTGLKTIVNCSKLSISKGSTDYGYVAYYADNVKNIGTNNVIIGNFIFNNNSNLLVAYIGNTKEVTLPLKFQNSNYSIGENVFQGNSDITSIIIPASVIAIGNNAFADCENITSITSYIPAEELFEISWKVFNGVNTEVCTLYVPAGAKETYATTDYWSDFTNIVEMNFAEKGDLDSDGEILIADATALIAMILDPATATDAADINSDGTVDVSDLTSIVSIILGTTDTGDEDDNNGDTPSTDSRAVDLGLSVKWAAYNVGATAPEEYGGYYAWGETEEKSNYFWSTYKYYNGTDDSMTKYCTSSGYGTVDGKTTLEASDDVATVKWGGAWRMPTTEEQQELIDNCTWQWTTLNGVNGYCVTGPNGNSIFLPAAGYRLSTGANYRGSNGFYWSSSLYISISGYAYYLSFHDGLCGWHYNYRFIGHTVRPVCP